MWMARDRTVDAVTAGVKSDGVVAAAVRREDRAIGAGMEMVWAWKFDVARAVPAGATDRLSVLAAMTADLSDEIFPVWAEGVRARARWEKEWGRGRRGGSLTREVRRGWAGALKRGR